MLLIILVLNFHLTLTKEYKCIYEPPINQTIIGIEVDPAPEGYREKRDAHSNLRIHYHYMDSFESMDSAALIKREVLEPARERLQKMLKPKLPLQGTLRINRKCSGGRLRKYGSKIACAYSCESVTKCIDTIVPAKYLKKCEVMDTSGSITESGIEGSGVVNQDLVLLIEAQTCSGNTAGYAASCFMEKTLDRPILGIVNLCSNVAQISNYPQLTYIVMMHEIIHALGFAKDKYAYYRDEAGNPLVPRTSFGFPSLGYNYEGSYYNFNENVGKTVTRKRKSSTHSYTRDFLSLTFPNLVKAAREHFNCPTIDSVDLEDSGGGGSALSHFDEYLFHDELMSPMINDHDDRLSIFTLKLLEATGWYKIDTRLADKLEYGYQSGCVLPLEGCFNYMASQKAKGASIEPFCDIKYQPGDIVRCSANYKYTKTCRLHKYSSVDAKYNYFSSLWAGNSIFAEYCPTYYSQQVDNCLVHSSGNDSKYDTPFYYGVDSRCFKNNIRTFVNDHYGATCMKMQCIQKDKLLPAEYNIYYNNSIFNCTQKNQEVAVSSNYNIICADPNVICENSTTTTSTTTDNNKNSLNDSTTSTNMTTKNGNTLKQKYWYYVSIQILILMKLL